MRCLMRLHLTCVFVRFADCDTSLFSRVLHTCQTSSLVRSLRHFGIAENLRPGDENLRHLTVTSRFKKFSFRIITFAICSSLYTRPVLKQACPSEKIRSHLFMNRAINISLILHQVCHAVDTMGDTRVLFKCATAVTVCGM